MALKKCRHCSGAVASNARICPHCGARRTTFLTKVVMWWFILTVVAIVATLAAACGEEPKSTIAKPPTSSKPKAGDSCPSVNKAQCSGTSTMLACEGNPLTLRAFPCRCSVGCVTEDGSVFCSPRCALESDPCVARNEGTAFCKDHATMFTCSAGQWRAHICKSAEGCDEFPDRGVFCQL